MKQEFWRSSITCRSLSVLLAVSIVNSKIFNLLISLNFLVLTKFSIKRIIVTKRAIHTFSIALWFGLFCIIYMYINSNTIKSNICTFYSSYDASHFIHSCIYFLFIITMFIIISSTMIIYIMAGSYIKYSSKRVDRKNNLHVKVYARGVLTLCINLVSFMAFTQLTLREIFFTPATHSEEIITLAYSASLESLMNPFIHTFMNRKRTL